MVKKLLLLLALVFTPAFANAPKPVLHTTHRIKMDTVFDHSLCSATAIGPHALLTATHCELGTDDLSIDGNGHYKISAKIRDEQDHTIFIVPDATFAEIADFATTEPEKGDDVWICGNPAGANQFARRGVLAGTANYIRWYDIHSFYGDSGAAVFNADGKIVDVISELHTETQDDDTFTLAGALPLGFTPEQLKQAQSK